MHFTANCSGKYGVAKMKLGSLKRTFYRKPDNQFKFHSINPHILRHSYAIHVHESGIDIRLIHEILGHKSSKITEIYTHVSTNSIKNVKSPLDDLSI